MFGLRGIGLDINGDGIPDVRVGRFGVRPDIGMAFMGGPPPFYGYGPMPYGGAFGQVRPDIGSFVPPPYYPYYPPPGYYY